MSNVSNRHQVQPFTAGESKPLSGQRLAKVGYKTSKKTPAKFKSVCVSVPQINPDDVMSNIHRLLPHVGTMLENAQDGIIRSLYEQSDGSLQTVADSDISVLACIAFLDAEAAGDRLKKEHIENWFDVEIAENLFVLVAEKLGFTEPNENQTAVIQKHVKTYRDVISMLAGGKTRLEEKQIKGCRVALNLGDCSQGIGQKLVSRLDQMERTPKIEDMLEL